MGGHLHRCNACGGEVPLYNSCGDRHCPKCQGGARATWLAERARELLPVEYFHVIFSVPHELTPVAAAHPANSPPRSEVVRDDGNVVAPALGAVL